MTMLCAAWLALTCTVANPASALVLDQPPKSFQLPYSPAQGSRAADKCDFVR